MSSSVSVLFVCLGNICRSPTAEGVFRHQVQQAGLAERVHIDSAGTGGWHAGEPPDRRSQKAAAARGVDLSQLRARQVQVSDFAHFDYILAMDRQNLLDLRRVAPNHAVQKPRLFLEFAERFRVTEVPDPYYGAEDGFEQVLDLVTDASEGLIRHLREIHGL